MRSLLVAAALLVSMLTANAQRASFILVTVDTLRADRVQEKSPVSPAMNMLAADGVRFTQAFAQVPITLPSHTSIMTGTYPMYHGIRDFGGFRLKQERQTLAELLKTQGYRTAAFVSSFALASEWGLDQGFDLYDDEFDLSGYSGVGFNAVERRGDHTMDRALSYLQSQAEEPFFLWVHLFDPHDPYTPPEPYKSRFPQSAYDAEIAFADAQIERLLTQLKESHLYQPSLIAVMGDHGEGLGDHGEETHGFFIYDTTVHIPLLMKFQGNEYGGTVFGEIVQSIDLAPTVLQVLRVDRGEEFQGRGLIGPLRGGGSRAPSLAYSESFYARYHFGWSSLAAYRDERYKYIRAPRRELYSASTDLRELNNLFDTETALGNQYDNLLSSLTTRFGLGQPQEESSEIDEETRQRLASLGYVALAAGKNNSDDDRDRPDPKDKIGVFQDIRLATIESEQRNFSGSIKRLTGVLATDPDLYSARYLQGFNYFQTEQYLLAIEQFKSALQLLPDTPDAIHSLAASYFRVGLNEAAQAGYEHLLRVEQDSSRAWIGMGDVAFKLQRPDQALDSYRKALTRESSPPARLGAGRALLALKRVDEALPEIQQVLDRYPNLPEALILMGLAYREKGDETKASEFFQRARSRQKPE